MWLLLLMLLLHSLLSLSLSLCFCHNHRIFAMVYFIYNKMYIGSHKNQRRDYHFHFFCYREASDYFDGVLNHTSHSFVCVKSFDSKRITRMKWTKRRDFSENKFGWNDIVAPQKHFISRHFDDFFFRWWKVNIWKFGDTEHIRIKCNLNYATTRIIISLLNCAYFVRNFGWFKSVEMLELLQSPSDF